MGFVWPQFVFYLPRGLCSGRPIIVHCFSVTPLELIFTASCIVAALGACYGTAKSGAAISAIGIQRPDLVMKNIIPVVMAGIIAIYGLVISILIITNLKAPPEYTLHK